MSPKDKLGLDKVVERFNKEFDKTSVQFNKLIGDAFKQLDSLQTRVQEPIKKVMNDLDKLRDREMNRFQSEFDKRIAEFSDLQQQLLDKIGLDKGKTTPKPKTVTKKAAPKKPAATATKKTARKAPAKKPAATATKTTARKAPAKKPAATATKTTARKAPAKKPAATATKITARKAPAKKR